MKSIRYVFILLLVNLLSAQIEKKEPKTFLFGLIKFDTESEYEDGYWINKWFFAREFASPVKVPAFDSSPGRKGPGLVGIQRFVEGQQVEIDSPMRRKKKGGLQKLVLQPSIELSA